MQNIIGGLSPSGNRHQSVNRGNVTQKQENKWAAELSRSRDASKNFIDYDTGELIGKAGVSKKHQIMIDRDAKRAENLVEWGNKLKELEDFAKSDPGVLLRKNYLEAKRVSDKRALSKSKLVVDFTKDLVPYSRPVGKSNLQEIVEHRNTRMVSEVTVGVQDVYMSAMVRGGKEQIGGGIRGEIVEFSKQSRARCERHIRNVPHDSIKAILTLTYPNVETDGLKVKRDLANFKKRLKRMGVRSGIWFLEFQLRGSPHFHAFFGQWPKGGVSAVAHAWYEVVGSNDPNHLAVTLGKVRGGRPCLEYMRNPHAASYYALKYGLKDEQKIVPEAYRSVGRFWGCWGNLRPVYEVYYARGVDSCVSLVRMIKWWKSIKFGGFVKDGVSTYSATLRGCTPDFLGSLMASTGWSPDG